MEDYGGGAGGGFDGGMGYPVDCIPMDNIGFSGSEVIGNQLPSTDTPGAEATADVSYINEGVDLDLDIKMPKMKFKQAKPKAVVPVRRTTTNYGGTFSIVAGCLVGVGIFLLLYFFVIRD